MASRVLKCVVFLGSGKNVVPPWGGPARLGDRVLAYVKAQLAARSKAMGGLTVTHEITGCFDPLEVFGPGGACEASGAIITTPHFFLKPGSAPAAMDAMRDTIKAADYILVVSALVPRGLLAHSPKSVPVWIRPI